MRQFYKNPQKRGHFTGTDIIRTFGMNIIKRMANLNRPPKSVSVYLMAKVVYGYLAKKYNIPAKNGVKEWVYAYKEFGKKGLMYSRKNNNCSFQFKLYVVELYLSSEVSCQELALSQYINNPALIARWVNDFRIVENAKALLKNAYLYEMNVNEYWRWLISKQRKEETPK